jgi:hypothetical protein
MLESPEKKFNPSFPKEKIEEKLASERFKNEAGQFRSAREKFEQELEEKGYHWIHKYEKEGDYFISLYNKNDPHLESKGKGANFETAFRNAIDEMDELNSKE